MIRHLLGMCLLAGLLLIAFVAVVGCPSSPEAEDEAESTDEDGFATAESVVDAYFAAALAQDLEAMRGLVRPDQRQYLVGLDPDDRDPVMEAAVDARYDEQARDETKVVFAATFLDAAGNAVMAFPFHAVRHDGRWYWDISYALEADDAHREDPPTSESDAATDETAFATAESVVDAYFAAALAQDTEALRDLVRPDQRPYLEDLDPDDRDPAMEAAVDARYDEQARDEGQVIFSAAFLDADGNAVMAFPFLVVRHDGRWYWDLSLLLDGSEMDGE